MGKVLGFLFFFLFFFLIMGIWAGVKNYFMWTYGREYLDGITTEGGGSAKMESLRPTVMHFADFAGLDTPC